GGAEFEEVGGVTKVACGLAPAKPQAAFTPPRQFATIRHPRPEDGAVAYPFFLTKLLARTGLGRLLITTQQRTDGAGEFLRYYGDRVLAAPLDDLGRAADFYGVTAPDAIDLAHGVPPQSRVALP